MTTLKVTMKTIVALGLFLAMTALPPLAQAQHQTDGPLSIGVQGGLTQTNFYGTDVGTSDWRPGFNAGAFLTWQLNPFIAVQPEVSWNVRGAKTSTTLLTGQSDRFRLDYIDIPVLLKVGLPFERIQPRLIAGPVLSILADAEINGATRDDDFNDVDFGAIFGLEVGIPLSEATNGLVKEIFIAGRYNVGIVDTNDANATDIFNNGFSQSIGLSFNL